MLPSKTQLRTVRVLPAQTSIAPPATVVKALHWSDPVPPVMRKPSMKTRSSPEVTRAAGWGVNGSSWGRATIVVASGPSVERTVRLLPRKSISSFV